MDKLMFEGEEYVSSKRASSITGYAKDYVGQLCRLGKLNARMVGRNWYVALSALEEHKKSYKKEIETFQRKEADTETKTVQGGVASATVFPKNKAKVEHYPRQMVEETVPLRYEADERPLIPHIESKKDTVNVAQVKQHSTVERPISSIQIQRTHANNSGDHAAIVGAGEIVPDPFEIARFEREIAIQQPISHRREDVSKAPSSFNKKVSNSQTVPRKLPIAKLGFAIGLLFLIALYGSVFVVEQRIYERTTTDNDYALVSSKLLNSGSFK